MPFMVMMLNVYEFRHSISNARTEFMSVEESAATPVLVAAVDNDRMALLALKGILPQLLPAAQWMWGAGTSETFV